MYIVPDVYFWLDPSLLVGVADLTQRFIVNGVSFLSPSFPAEVHTPSFTCVTWTFENVI